MLNNSMEFKEKLINFIKRELKGCAHIYITEYYGAYTLTEELVNDLLACRQFRIYIDDHFVNYLSVAMTDLIADQETKDFIENVIEEFQCNPFYLDDLMYEMLAQN